MLGELPGSLRYEHIDPDDLPASADEVEFYVLPYRFRPADGEALATLPKLQVVQTLTAGVEHIRRLRARGRAAVQRARHPRHLDRRAGASALILASLRGIPRVRARPGASRVGARSGGESLADKRVLIVGYGQIGEAIEARIRPFEADVVRVARSARDGVHAIDELPDLLPDADVVVLIVPGHRRDHRPLRRRDAGADEGRRAARQRLPRPGRRHRRPARGAARASGSTPPSTWSTPSRCRRDHPLWQAPNLLLVPHVGGNSTAMEPRAHRLVREQLQRFAAGEPTSRT